MKPYTERQLSYLIIATMGGIIGLLCYGYGFQIGTNPITLPLLIFMLPQFLIVLLLFYEMKTVVYDDRIVIRYGIGAIKRTFYLKDLSRGRVKKIPWYYGAGIRYYADGTLYSIGFTNAVEFRQKYKGRSIAIGSKTPQALLANIQERINRLEATLSDDKK